jgi:hypothetical protein
MLGSDLFLIWWMRRCCNALLCGSTAATKLTTIDFLIALFKYLI